MTSRPRACTLRRGMAHPVRISARGGSLILLLSLVTPATAATFPSEWKPFGLQGLDLRAIAAAPDLLCAGVTGQGIHGRDIAASGSTGVWVPNGLGGTIPSWLWIDPIRPMYRHVALGWMSPPFHSLYRTLDGGASWFAIDNFPTLGGRAWAVNGVPNAGPLWAAGDSVWISNNLGVSWVKGNIGEGSLCIEVAPTDPLEVWTGGEGNSF